MGIRNVSVYADILKRHEQGLKALAVLLDPDKLLPESDSFRRMSATIERVQPDYILVGGSTMHASVDDFVRALDTKAPIILFPGSADQFTEQADALLFLSLISGRNADYLIGEQVRRAVQIKKSGVESIPTGYILLDGGTDYSTLRVTHTEPLSQADTDMVVNTAVAGELLGQRVIYLEAGSGATRPVCAELIRAVRAAIDIPLIVGGGLRTEADIKKAYDAGADIVVIGNHLEARYL